MGKHFGEVKHFLSIPMKDAKVVDLINSIQAKGGEFGNYEIWILSSTQRSTNIKSHYLKMIIV